ncbi:nuclear transport factor 2 family protein [Aestuariirhabdus sp. Z084]|uniref:nuclear transport factor 2 family protein n=1 Tax=Aestuariirhabdus haliotis TaxID=2918751 RepID=UPI00201B3894|nr:nuclear transport factor 2 family protein [Aestuariirhabdus haliotis]MCL6414096.1 nuclear transport factor 2 family protein [Aestuariirhabdus haliotis]MCL6418028.1 nuclear transport factor 2 family protein [Aestuariirhabdus haliotis]
MIEQTLAHWHQLLDSKDPAGLQALLADEVVFHSPVVHTPQIGKPLTTMYLTAAMQVLANPSFRYLREVSTGQDAILEFETEIGGIHINGVDMIRCDDEGKIVDFKVMLRPLKAVNMVHQMMGQLMPKK